jgi:N-acetylglucosamine-6-sulfatase
VDGSSLLPLLTNASASWRSDFLIEHLHLKQNLPPPTYCAVRSARYLYVVYDTGEQELYDLQSDPNELDNRAADPAYADALATMQERLRTLCSPPPPGLTLP